MHVPIGAKLRRAVVAAPTYFAAHAKPGDPRERVKRNCINMGMQSGGGLHVLDFQCKDKQLNVRVDGQLTFNTSPNVVDAALAGLGIAWLPEEQFAPHMTTADLAAFWRTGARPSLATTSTTPVAGSHRPRSLWY